MEIEIIGPAEFTKALKDKIEQDVPEANVTDANETERDERVLALAAHLGCDPDDIIENYHGDYSDFDCVPSGGTYLVLTDSEADKQTEECIRESVWAFNASFLQDYGAFEALTDKDIDLLRGDKCEDINEAFVLMIGDDWDHFVADAISADGRGHFLNHWDGNEHESDGFYIYRTN